MFIYKNRENLIIKKCESILIAAPRLSNETIHDSSLDVIFSPNGLSIESPFVNFGNVGDVHPIFIPIAKIPKFAKIKKYIIEIILMIALE